LQADGEHQYDSNELTLHALKIALSVHPRKLSQKADLGRMPCTVDLSSRNLYNQRSVNGPFARRSMSTAFVLNGKSATLDADPKMPLLWAIREVAGLPGTKFGCGMALCGACTVHLDGKAIRSCVTPLSSVAGRNVTTIEGLASAPAKAMQAAWIKIQVPQCGYCQSGQIMSATALLETNSAPSDADIDSAMSGNICRCATYSRIRAAIHAAADSIKA
jgi:isoquinoline 1-oxidoreductase alpha subunit